MTKGGLFGQALLNKVMLGGADILDLCVKSDTTCWQTPRLTAKYLLLQFYAVRRGRLPAGFVRFLHINHSCLSSNLTVTQYQDSNADY